MELLILLALLQIKHFVADFVIQTYMQTVKKGVWLHPVGVSHSIDHAYCSLIVLLAFSMWWTVSPQLILLVVLVESVLHYIIDYTKVRFGNKNMVAPLFWTQFGLDQLLHQLTYIGMAYSLI